MSEVTREQDEAISREMDAHGEALKKAVEQGRCLKCRLPLETQLLPRAIRFQCNDYICGWFAVYAIRTIGNSERAQRDARPEFTTQGLVAIREALATVIDDGCNCDSGEKHPWEFYEDGTEGGDVDAFTEDMANQQRMRFADAIQNYLTRNK